MRHRSGGRLVGGAGVRGSSRRRDHPMEPGHVRQVIASAAYRTNGRSRVRRSGRPGKSGRPGFGLVLTSRGGGSTTVLPLTQGHPPTGHHRPRGRSAEGGPNPARNGSSRSSTEPGDGTASPSEARSGSRPSADAAKLLDSARTQRNRSTVRGGTPSLPPERHAIPTDGTRSQITPDLLPDHIGGAVHHDCVADDRILQGADPNDGAEWGVDNGRSPTNVVRRAKRRARTIPYMVRALPCSRVPRCSGGPRVAGSLRRPRPIQPVAARDRMPTRGADFRTRTGRVDHRYPSSLPNRSARR